MGHTRAGWCPQAQRYAVGGAADKRLTRWRQLVEGPPPGVRCELEASAEVIEAKAFIDAVRAGEVAKVKQLLQKSEELILLPVESGFMPSSHWTWSILHEAAFQLRPEHDESSKTVQTFCTLVEFCNDIEGTWPKNPKHKRIDVNCSLPRNSSSRASVVHEVADKGNRYAMLKLISCGGDLFARTRSDWLPIHNALKHKAPAYSPDKSFAKWLLDKMKEQPAFDVNCLAKTPKGFKPEHSVDMEALEYLRQMLI